MEHRMAVKHFLMQIIFLGAKACSMMGQQLAPEQNTPTTRDPLRTSNQRRNLLKTLKLDISVIILEPKKI